MKKIMSLQPSEAIAQHYTLKQFVCPAKTLLGYKVITMDADNANENHNEAFKNIKSSQENWSGTYINKDILTALNYCPTKLEQYDNIQLVKISTKTELNVIFCKDYLDDVKPENTTKKLMENPEEALKIALNNELNIDLTKPILHALGEQHNAAFISYDANDTEIAFPHSLNHNDFLTIEQLATFTVNKKYGFKEVSKINFSDKTISIESGVNIESELSNTQLIVDFPPANYNFK